MGVGIAAGNIPSIENAKRKAIPIFSFIDEKSTLDARDISEERISSIGSGKIEFKEVSFRYPSKQQHVLDSFDMEIPEAAKIALVGHSGCGKSTITNLLLRFYSIKSG